MELDNQHYEDPNQRIIIDLNQNNKETYGVWLDKGQIIIEFNFNHAEKKFNSLEGIIGNVIKNSDLSVEDKITRCFESIENGLWVAKMKNLSSKTNNSIKP